VLVPPVIDARKPKVVEPPGGRLPFQLILRAVTAAETDMASFAETFHKYSSMDYRKYAMPLPRMQRRAGPVKRRNQQGLR
jgi:hypothetical protein